MQELLQKVGLNPLQAQAYLLLLDRGAMSPAEITKHLKSTRTNTYKVLDRLVEMGLASRSEIESKIVYSPEDPSALASFVAEERNRVLALEQATHELLTDLKNRYKKATAASEIGLFKGRAAVVAAYEQQAGTKKPIHFIKSRADIPALSFEKMDYVRKLTQKTGVERFGITQDTPEASANNQIDKKSNLFRTWIDSQDYTAPVEWSVSDNLLNIIVFDKNPYVIKVKDAAIADAFAQIWQLLDKSLRQIPEYNKYPKKARREI